MLTIFTRINVRAYYGIFERCIRIHMFFAQALTLTSRWHAHALGLICSVAHGMRLNVIRNQSYVCFDVDGSRLNMKQCKNELF